jgi:hypothetical protein
VQFYFIIDLKKTKNSGILVGPIGKNKQQHFHNKRKIRNETITQQRRYEKAKKRGIRK